MFVIKKCITPFLMPPGIFIIVLLFSALWFFTRKNWKAGGVNLFIGCLMWFFSIPPVGNALLATLERQYPIPQNVQGDVIILLGHGVYDKAPDMTGVGAPTEEASAKVLTAVRLYRKQQMPIIACGGKPFGYRAPEAPILKRFLIDLGVSPEDIIMEGKSRDTIENARFAKEICEQLGYEKPILITSAFHMPRAVLSFKKVGLPVTPFPTNFKTWENRTYAWNNYLPRSFRYVFLSMKQHLGMVFYQLAY